MNGHVDDDRLIDLVHGLLPADEEAESLGHVRRCGPCEERLRGLASEHERVRVEVAARLERGRALPRRSRYVRGIGLAGAAAVAAALLLVLLLPRPGPQAAAPAAYWLPVDREEVVLRSAIGAESSELSAALEAYRARDARLAAERLARANVGQAYEDLRRLYLASALALAGRYDEAEREHERLSEDTLPEPWRGRARWLHYTILRDAGREDEARSLLRELSARSGEAARLARAERERLELR